MLVIDASVALAWALPDEDDALAWETLDRVAHEGALVPAIWPLEVGNGLLTAHRRKRLTANQLGESLSLLRELPIRISAPDPITELGTVLTLARTQGLTTYDAAYLEVAMRNSTGLATLDENLRKAARRLGVSLELD